MNSIAFSLALALLASLQICLVSGGTTTTTTGCIEVTVPDIFGIGKCMQDSLDLCSNNKTAVPGMVSLVNCTTYGLMTNLTPIEAFGAVLKILIAVINKIIPLPPLTSALLGTMAETSISSIYNTNGVCEGEIKIGFPGSIGKCLNETLKLCTNGTTVDTPIVQSLISALLCVVNYVLTTAPAEVLRTILCDVSISAKAAIGPRSLIGSLLEPACPKP